MRLLSLIALFGMLAAPTAPAALSVQQEPSQASFTLPPLPYPADALEPVIDAETMALHHDRHHQSYVDGLNRAVGADPALANQSLESLLARVGSLPPAIRNNGGGHWNHAFFWSIMVPPGSGGAPSPALLRAIEQSFGSMDVMQRAFREAGTARFGSGWVWLIVRSDGSLAITTTPNQDNPLMDIAEVRGVPILGNDLWEHAYYLRHRNRRADYLDNWWQVVNWETASRYYAHARLHNQALKGAGIVANDLGKIRWVSGR